MIRRMGVAVLALVGVFVATYLTLFKAGFLGELTCGIGSCNVVNLSRWSVFLGIPVAAWGVAFYVFLLVVALVGLQGRFEDSRFMAAALVWLTGWGVVFSLWLTYLELFVIYAICMWCVISAIIVTLCFILALWDWIELRRERLSDAPGEVGVS
jgi:uncharacterized membrane protein